ncbi:hypothetical protein ETAE_1855 [Edwardsiella piscicida]|uniref:Uncharacterized protein n=2 Tax=Edwardsiella TaxID=635 RepID=A0A0H3DQX6_EDWTF|nr:hypothetical protein ETAE_1855 [Edwardsiella tarda EIB202]ADM41780.1 hypothetical protein ETAF_1672 [Edwardsiella tarda FL6-60]
MSTDAAAPDTGLGRQPQALNTNINIYLRNGNLFCQHCSK